MSDPIVFVVRHRIKPGMAEAFRKHYADSLPRTMSDKPGTLVQVMYEDEAGTEVTTVRVFPDADALEAQLQGSDERSKKTYEFIEPLSMEILGTPNPATLERMQKIAGSGIPVSITPRYLGGFIR